MWPRDTNILDIPLELVAEICQNLPQAATIALASTCAQIRQILRGQYLSLHIYIGGSKQPTMAQIAPKHTTVTITRSAQALTAVVFLCEYATCIHKLDIHLYFTGSLPHMPALTSLKISGGGKITLPAGLPKLHTLCIHNNEVTDIANVQYCPDLHTVNIRDTQVADITPLQYCPNIVSLRVATLCVSTMHAIAHHTRLQSLSIGSWQTHGEILLPALPVSLTAIKLVNSLGNWAALYQVPHLRSLDILDIKYLRPSRKRASSSSAADIAAVLARLTSLCICGGVYDDIDCIAQCGNLHTLRIAEIGNPVSLAPLSACTNLQTLRIGHIGAPVIDFDLPHLTMCVIKSTSGHFIPGLQNSPELRRLNLSGTWIAELPAGIWSANLVELVVANTHMHSLVGLTLPSLQTLDISHSRIRDIMPLAACANLSTLIMNSSPVSDIMPLVTCQSLRYLDARLCRLLPPAADMQELPDLFNTGICDDIRPANDIVQMLRRCGVIVLV